MDRDKNSIDEEIGLTCLYKNGEAKEFIGEEVRKAESEGWMDTPQPKKEETKNTEPGMKEKSVQQQILEEKEKSLEEKEKALEEKEKSLEELAKLMEEDTAPEDSGSGAVTMAGSGAVTLEKVQNE